MQLNEVETHGLLVQSIDTVNEKKIMIDDCQYDSSLYIVDNKIHSWNMPTIKHLSIAGLQPIIDSVPQLIIIGIRQFTPRNYLDDLDKSVQITLVKQGIGCEISSVSAACKTWNIVLAEQRKIALALII